MPVKIQLDSRYWLMSDSSQWILAEKGIDRLQVEGYYCTIERLLKSYLDKKMRDSKADSIHSLLEYIKLVLTRLNKALQPLEISIETKKPLKNNTINNPPQEKLVQDGNKSKM